MRQSILLLRLQILLLKFHFQIVLWTFLTLLTLFIALLSGVDIPLRGQLLGNACSDFTDNDGDNRVDLIGGGLGRLAAATLGAGEDRLISQPVMDSAGTFGYFGTYTIPGKIVRRRLADLADIGALPLSVGEDNLLSAVIDRADPFASAYFATDTNPAKIVKVRTLSFTRVGALTLNAGDEALQSAVIDGANGFAYFGSFTSPGTIVKIDLGTFTRAGSLTLNPTEEFLSSAVIDTTGGFAYFSTFTSPGQIVKVDLNTFQRVDAITLDPTENQPSSGVIDAANGFAYFATQDAASDPGELVKIRLSDFTRVSAVTVDPPTDSRFTVTIDSAGQFAYLGTSQSPGTVWRVDLSSMAVVGTKALQAGEDNLTSSGFADGSAYFGTNTLPGRIVKVGPLPPEDGCESATDNDERGPAVTIITPTHLEVLRTRTLNVTYQLGGDLLNVDHLEYNVFDIVLNRYIFPAYQQENDGDGSIVLTDIFRPVPGAYKFDLRAVRADGSRFANREAESSINVSVEVYGTCSDGADNDGDGATDHPADFGCESSTDPNEEGPSIVITSPAANQVFPINAVSVTYQHGGDPLNVDHVHYKVDGGAEQRDTDNDGVIPLSGLSAGAHTIQIYVARADHTLFLNAEAVAFLGFSVSLTQCGDGGDNDGDGFIDTDDPGCHTDGNASNLASYDLSDNDETHAAACGNGVIESGEQCDDGNGVSGDGCDASCQLENVTLCMERLGPASQYHSRTADTAIDTFDAERFVVVYGNGATDAQARAGRTLPGGIITWDTPGTTFTAGAASHLDVATMDADTFVVVHDGVARAGTVNGGTITWGSPMPFGVGIEASVTALNQTTFVVAYQDGTNTTVFGETMGSGFVRVGTVSNETITWVTNEVLFQGGVKETALTTIDSQRFLLAYTLKTVIAGNAVYNGIVTVGTFAGGTVSFPTGIPTTFPIWNGETHLALAMYKPAAFVLLNKVSSTDARIHEGGVTGTDAGFFPDEFGLPLNTPGDTIGALDVIPLPGRNYAVGYERNGTTGVVAVNPAGGTAPSTEATFPVGGTGEFALTDVGNTFAVAYEDPAGAGTVSASHCLLCADGVDNDGDAATDFPSDLGCVDTLDDDEGGPIITISNPLDGATVSTGTIPVRYQVTGDPYFVTSSTIRTVDGGSSQMQTALLVSSNPDTWEFTLSGLGNGQHTLTLTLARLGSAFGNPEATDTVTFTVNIPQPQCSDVLDNDGDGLMDTADPGCHTDGNAANSASYDRSDDDEANSAQCGNGIIEGTEECDDGNAINFDGCSASCLIEIFGDCKDSADNDADAETDHPADLGCLTPLGPNEWQDAECFDGVDNDGDGAVDGADFSCIFFFNGESRPRSRCQDGKDNDGDNAIDLVDTGCASAQDHSER